MIVAMRVSDEARKPTSQKQKVQSVISSIFETRFQTRENPENEMKIDKKAPGTRIKKKPG